MQCGSCTHIHITEGQSYHDCRANAPSVVVPGFKQNADSNYTTFGKIMTVWPRVSKDEKGCGQFKPKASS